MTTETNQSEDSVTLECDHCGCVAIESADGMFYDGQGDACMSCGFPGHVSVDEAPEDETAEAHWSLSDYCEIGEPIPVCTDANCEDCKEWRGKIHTKGDGYGF
jgi:hypothetical protein